MPKHVPRCEALPQPEHQVSFQIDGKERLRWHYGSEYPRPFFYPVAGPSGTSLTRMGHPGDWSHEHHRSVWFAHHDVMGLDFWSDRTKAQIRQKRWLAYFDSDEECAMGCLIGWYDGHDAELMEQELVAAVRPAEKNGVLIELQATFRPSGKELALGQTNFGFLAVRVAKNISAHFGGGEITNSEGAQGEEKIFGKPARWMDYSGPVKSGGVEGITYFDHADNPGQPTRWHVREDGWMGASVCREAAITIRKDKPMRVRYLLHVHAGDIQADTAQRLYDNFQKLPPYEVPRVRIKHQGYQIRRVGSD